MAIHTNTFLIYFREKAEKDKEKTNKAKKELRWTPQDVLSKRF